MSSRLSISGPVKQLCSTCSTEISRPRYPYPASGIDIKDFEELLSSSLNGCNFCRLCKDAIQQYFPGSEIGPVSIYATEYSGLTLIVPLKDAVSAKLELCWEQQPVEMRMHRGRALSRYTDSEKCMNLLRSWFRDCSENPHAHCTCVVPPGAYLPTRVISIGEGTSPTFLRTSTHYSAPYVTLSHCWGGSCPLRLTNSNLEELKRGIIEEHLPKTFRDAIFVVRQLGFHYLWIDSLCILQDDVNDWSLEAERMGSYYENAAFTIAADVAANCYDGFLGERPNPAWRSINLKGADYGLSGDAFVRCSPLPSGAFGGYGFGFGQTFPLYTHPYHKAERIRSPLSSRAWVLQEWALAKRTVHFFKDEIVWECEHHVLCECSPDEVGKKRNPIRLGGPSPKASCFQGYNFNSDDCYEGWRAAVMELTDRELTRKTDLLPAISGIADHTSLITGGTYVCGIWQDDLQSLLWDTEDPARAQRHAVDYAPSWSWASTKTPVRWWHWDDEDESFHPKAEVLHIDWTPATKNVFGPPKGRAKLTLRGQTFAAQCPDQLNHRHGTWNKLPVGSSSEYVIFQPDFFVERCNEEQTRRVSRESYRDIGPYVYPGDTVVCLILLKVTVDASFDRGLVLKCIDESSFLYQRVGTFDSVGTDCLAPALSKTRDITII